MLGIALKLLGIGKAIVGWGLGIIKSAFEFAQRRPVLALFIAVDILLVLGCWKGYQAHLDAQTKAAQIVDLKQDLKEKDSLIELLYQRVKEYARALTDAQQGRVKDIEQHNKAVAELKRIADGQLAEAQKRAEQTRKQRDAYMKIAENYRRAGKTCVDAAARIKCEEALNAAFIREVQSVTR